ncbi:MAG: amino acid-binding ACT [Gemmataceae bacterium]|nr:amino acid-binding ACT [Gemmataceae bacterium]
MAYDISKVEVWTGEIEDQVGGLAAKMQSLADAGVDLAFVVARRQPHVPGKGIVFLGPIKGVKGTKAAAASGLTKGADIAVLRVEGPNKAGSCHAVISHLGAAGINLRGLSASVIGKRFVVILAFDNEADAAKASQILRAAGRKGG